MRYTTEPLLKLTRDESEEKGRELMRLIDEDIDNREMVLRRRAMLRDMYAGLPDSCFDSENGVTIHLPLIAEKIDGTVPKVINAFMNAEPIVHVRRIAAEFNIQASERVERFLNWAILTDVRDFYQTFEQWIRNCLVDGVAVLKLYWDYCERTTVITQMSCFYWYAGDTDLSMQKVPEDRLKLPIEILMEIFGTNARQNGIVEVLESSLPLDQETDSLEGLTALVSIVENRILFEGVEVQFHESHYIDEIIVTIKRPIIQRDAPRAELIAFEDFVVPFRTDNILDAPRVAHLCEYTLAELKYRADKCHYELDEDDWDILRGQASTSPEDEDASRNNSILKNQKDRQIGENDGMSTAESMHGTYGTERVTVREVYCSDDVNGDGINEEVIYIIPEPLGRIVRSYYLDELFPHGRRPFLDLHFRRDSERWYSVGMAELLAGIQLEVDSIISMVNYAQEVINNPWFFYEPTSFLDDAKNPPRGLRPGEGRMVSSVGGILFPKFMQEPLANLSTMDSLLMFADRLTLSPMSGGSPQVRNAPRTARGTLALLSEAGIKIDMFITAAQFGPWQELIHQMHALYTAYGPDEKFFYVTGSKKPEKISQDDLRGRYEFAFSGNTVNTNKEVMRSIAQIRYNALVANPLYTMDLKAMQNLIRDFLKYFGDGANSDELVPKAPELAADHAPMDQKTEIRYILQGTPLSVLPADDHAQHLTDLMSFQNGSEFKMIEPWQVAMLAMHGAQHAQALQQLQMQGGMAPPTSGGQANNVPSELGASDSLSDLEGGVQ